MTNGEELEQLPEDLLKEHLELPDRDWETN